MRLNFGIDIACSPWLAEKLVETVNRAKAEQLIKVILLIKGFPITNDKH